MNECREPAIKFVVCSLLLPNYNTAGWYKINLNHVCIEHQHTLNLFNRIVLSWKIYVEG